jgi:cold shock CspA family protein
MSKQSPSAVCQRCGAGFLVTSNYLDQLRRWGVRESVPQLCVRCFRHKGPVRKRRGTVQRFDRRKRYGFIVGEQGERVFVHQNALYEANGSRPYAGQPVLYHVRYAIEGSEALNVELLEPKQTRAGEARER